MTFSVKEIPFSCYLSWLNLSPIVAEKRVEQDLHLVTHQTGLHAILALIPQQLGGRRVETNVQADPTQLSWRHEAGDIHAAFESVDTVRLRGQGLSIKILSAAATLTPFTGSYFFIDPVDEALIYTSYESGRRYRITTLLGHRAVLGDQALTTAERGAVIEPDDSGHWEIVIEEFETSRSPYVLQSSFAEVTAAVGCGVPPVPGLARAVANGPHPRSGVGRLRVVVGHRRGRRVPAPPRCTDVQTLDGQGVELGSLLQRSGPGPRPARTRS